MTWHLATNHITSRHLTANHVTHFISPRNQPHDIKTGPIGTSPPWNGWRLVRTKTSVWASHWLVSLRTFYRQILSLAYSCFPFWNFSPRFARLYLCDIKMNYIISEHVNAYHISVFSQTGACTYETNIYIYIEISKGKSVLFNTRPAAGCVNCPNWMRSRALATSHISKTRVANERRGISLLMTSCAARSCKATE